MQPPASFTVRDLDNADRCGLVECVLTRMPHPCAALASHTLWLLTVLVDTVYVHRRASRGNQMSGRFFLLLPVLRFFILPADDTGTVAGASFARWAFFCFLVNGAGVVSSPEEENLWLLSGG
jgi:hypothetical protein